MLYVRYHSTNCFFVRSASSDRLLAIDAGWPGTLYEYARLMKTIGCNLEKIAWAIVTHFHMDHAGLIGDFIERGVACHAFAHQLGAIDAMERTIEKNRTDYRRIDRRKLRVIDVRDSRKLLEGLGIFGEVVITDYHSPDSVTFISREKEAVIGDLPPEGQMMPDDEHCKENWRLVRGAGATMIYPSHAEIFRLDDAGAREEP